jgi:uroporphyrin-III C-methyltransferase / precorrin-2 dehydrogenase / sirohydrochlorin ferrochelatase
MSRIESLATLPVFLKLSGKHALLVGHTEGAMWKKELLEAAGAIIHHQELFIARDFKNKAIAIIDADENEARRFYALAKDAGVPVNCVDKPDLCDFSFGGIVNRSPLIVSISTDGASPVFGQRVREKIEMLLPLSLKKWALKAVDYRAEFQKQERPFKERRAFWERFTESAFQDKPVSYEDLLQPVSKKGHVTLVGAGPGDPDLLTVKAIRALQSADIILFDDLVSDAVLELARREAIRVNVGKRGGRPSCKQSEINQLLIDYAKEGLHVVRLKSGDPMVFGRAGEEITALENAGFEVKVVPGISAAQGAAASLKVSLTHRDHSKRVQFVTGHAKNGELPDDLAWAAIADPKVTTALYMPRKTLKAFADKAIAEGLDPQTPAIAICNVSLENEAHVRGTLQDLPGKMGQLDPLAPTLVMIGAAISA